MSAGRIGDLRSRTNLESMPWPQAVKVGIFPGEDDA